MLSTWATTAASTVAENVDICAVGLLLHCSKSASLFCTINTSCINKSQITEIIIRKIRKKIEMVI